MFENTSAYGYREFHPRFYYPAIYPKVSKRRIRITSHRLAHFPAPFYNFQD